jgi:undecaprenyl-diphosphatase
MLDAIAALDLAVVRWVTSTLRAGWLDPVMIGLSWVGLYGMVFVAVGAVVTALRRGWTMMALWRLVLAVALAQVVTVNVLKPLLPRERPWAAGVGVTAVVARPSQDSAMPSGHAATAVAGAVALSLLWPRGRVLAWVLALAIMASRLYLGVHYPSDLLVGASVGGACALVATVRMPAERPVAVAAAAAETGPGRVS